MTDGYAEEKAGEAQAQPQTEPATQDGASATAQQPTPEADAEEKKDQE